ncbi:MAG: XkdF-like putative serine protease domain-containing protein [Candidatus Parvarchaeum sp.]
MCWSCGCNDNLEDDHGDDRNITTATLEDAANAAGLTLDDVIENINLAYGHFDPNFHKAASSTPDMVAYHLIKSRCTEERRFTLGVAYPAMKADVGIAADRHRDFVQPEVLEEAAWKWLATSRRVNIFHDSSPLAEGHFTPTESYIYRGPDWVVKSPVDGRKYVIKSGDWLIGGIWDEAGWEAVKAGHITGWSPEGIVKRKIPERRTLSQLRRPNGR